MIGWKNPYYPWFFWIQKVKYQITMHKLKQILNIYLKHEIIHAIIKNYLCTNTIRQYDNKKYPLDILE